MFKLALSLAFCLFVFSSAQADSVILTGSATGSMFPGPNLGFNFAGDGFSAQGGGGGNGIIVFSALAPFYHQGDSINLGLTTLSALGWPDTLGGTLTIGGNTYFL